MSTPAGGGRVLVATRNPGKLRELAPMLVAAGFEPVGLAGSGAGSGSISPAAPGSAEGAAPWAGLPPDDAEDLLEVHETFRENALAKARWFRLRSGLATIADDSGLVVEALGGAPGVRSRRFSGRSDLDGAALDAANNALLLERLADVSDRRAAFVCAAAYVSADGGLELVGEGRTEGRIVGPAEGGGGLGFGYDPWFWSEELGATFGDSSREAKEEVSHRGRAVRALLSRVADATRQG